MNTHDHANKSQNEPTPASIELVDLEDLRAAFGGEGLTTGSTSAQAQPVPSTVMCPSW
ncbi:MAG: hypothetical protein R3B09_00760 [Nannocystaceae bacterium]